MIRHRCLINVLNYEMKNSDLLSPISLQSTRKFYVVIGVIYIWKTVHWGRTILGWSFRKWGGSMDWIDLAQNRDRWWALVLI